MSKATKTEKSGRVAGGTTSARFPGWWQAAALAEGTTLTRKIADKVGEIAAALEVVEPDFPHSEIPTHDKEIVNFPSYLMPHDAGGFASPTARFVAAVGKALRLPKSPPKTVRRIALLDRGGEPIRYVWVPATWGTNEIKTGVRKDRILAVCGWAHAKKVPLPADTPSVLGTTPWHERKPLAAPRYLKPRREKP